MRAVLLVLCMWSCAGALAENHLGLSPSDPRFRLNPSRGESVIYPGAGPCTPVRSYSDADPEIQTPLPSPYYPAAVVDWQPAQPRTKEIPEGSKETCELRLRAIVSQMKDDYGDFYRCEARVGDKHVHDLHSMDWCNHDSPEGFRTVMGCVEPNWRAFVDELVVKTCKRNSLQKGATLHCGPVKN